MNFGDTLLIGRYSATKTILHKINPRIKLALFLLLSGAIFFIKGTSGLAIYALLFIVPFVAAARIRITVIAKNAMVLSLFFIILFFSYLLSDANGASYLSALLLSLKLIYAMIIATVLTFSTMPFDLIDAMDWFLRPLKKLRFPVDDFVFVTLLSLRFVPVAADITARAAAEFKQRKLKMLKNAGQLIVSIINNVLSYSRDVALALEIRKLDISKGLTGDKKSVGWPEFFFLLYSAAGLIILFIV